MDINELYNSVHTVGAFIIYKEKFAFMIGPCKEKGRLRIVRFGGHLEQGETIYQCLHREMLEEISTNVRIVNSPVTYYKSSWEDTSIGELGEKFPLAQQPITVVGNRVRSTMLFFAYADSELKPASETHAIVFLSKEEVKEICTSSLSLKEFLNKHGEILQQKKIDYYMEMVAGPHLKFLYSLILDNESLIDKFIKGNL